MATETTRVRLGELLVQAGALTQERLTEALRIQKEEGGKRRLGKLLVECGFIDETSLTQQLGRHLSVPWVSLYHVDFSRQLLNLVPREVAESYGLIPVYVRHVRGQGETLYVATDDPTNEDGLKRAAAYAGLPVRAMIASASDIRHAIRVYYGGERIGAAPVPPPAPVIVDVTPRGAGPTEPKPAARIELVAAPPPTVRAKPEPIAAPPLPGPPPAPVAPPAPPVPAVPAVSAVVPTYDDSPEIEAVSIQIPPRKPKKGRSIALTFLDGTTISLPSPRGARKAEPEPEPEEEPAEHETQLTARDLVAALRAVAQGAEPTEVLGENPRWEKLFAALLSLMLRKHLIADWEFVEEFKKL
jgi:type IV pilus assembly protein PilB